MDAVQTYVPNQQILAAELNGIQARAVGMQRSDNFNHYADPGTLLPEGLTSRLWLASTGVMNDTVSALIDASIDWRDRVLVVQYSAGAAVTERPGSANDYLADYAVTTRRGYTGRGALDAGAAAPSTGNPPVPASGSSWAMKAATNVWLYAHPTTGALYVYNATGGDIFVPQILVLASAPTGWRP